MIFPKPKLKYTEMAMYVDDKINSDSYPTEEELESIYIYLYHIIRMLAYKHKYFTKTYYYDDFSLTVAADMMNRFIYNPKLYQLDEQGNPKMEKIKSCLNYIKSVLYGRKVAFEQKAYSQKISPQSENINLTDFSFANQIRSSNREIINSNINLYLNDLGKTISNYIDQICIYKDVMIKKNIKISCYLSLLGSVIFTESVVDDVVSKYKTPKAKYSYLCGVYERNRENSIVLYHLDESLRNYIVVLVRRIYGLIESDIKLLNVEDHYVSDSVLADIAFSELDGRVVFYEH